MARLLNLGCGSTFHPDWTNLDFAPRPPYVLGYDLRHGVPFPDGLFDAVYHSHVLEHIPRRGAPDFLRECLRVLRPGGILRVAVPDLEGAARAYLGALEEAAGGMPGADDRHEWMVIELVDQLTRHVHGGEMLEHWRRDPVPARDFILSRVGAEARRGMDAVRGTRGSVPERSGAHDVGSFRLSGECHLWMYDRHSLARLLREAGFEDVHVVRADESAIGDFARYGLDVEPDGAVRKPDSLFMEARRPRQGAARAPRVVGFCMKHAGGAGGAANRLHQGLLAVDVASFLYVAHSGAPERGVAVIPATGKTTLASGDDGSLEHSGWPHLYAVRRARATAYPSSPTHCEIFTESETLARISEIPGMDAADIIQLHWISGTVDICRDVDFLRGRPIVWTLHDMNPFTGGCHYAEDCRGFERHCGACPQLGSTGEKDLSREQWIRKKTACRELDITVVCPSNWLAGEVRRSSLLGRADVRVIPNGVPTEVFRPLNRQAIRQSLGLRPDEFVLLFGADNLQTRRKGFAELTAALELLRPEGGAAFRLLTFGHTGSVDFGSLPVPVEHLGVLRTPGEVALACNAADCLLMPTLADNLPNVVLEAMACGLPVAGFATGGVPDMVEDGATGLLVPTGDSRGLAAAVTELRALPAETMRQMRLRCRQTVLSRFTLLHQARAYAALYEELLAARQG